jgi:beta-alanine--pyruvate transaminase
MKTAIAYHRARGEGSRFRLIGRERGYHGSGFGGVSVGGIGSNRKMFGPLLVGADHIRHTHEPARNAFSRGLTEHGEEFADDLDRVIALHNASTIAGSTGVLVPPKGYLERIRAICDRHGVLLIFDEVITGFGRLGTPFAVDFFGVTPDLMTLAKGMTSGVIPMGAVLVRKEIYDALMQGPEHLIEFAHGYTYSGHPVACAAALGAIETYRDEDLFARAHGLAGYWEDAVHSLKGLPHVIDVCNLGLIGAIELEAMPGEATRRAFSAFLAAFEKGLLIRTTGDIIALSPPLIICRAEIDQIVEILSSVLKGLH